MGKIGVIIKEPGRVPRQGDQMNEITEADRKRKRNASADHLRKRVLFPLLVRSMLVCLSCVVVKGGESDA